MSLKEIETEQLVMLWQASDGNPLLKQQIESEFQNRIANNSNFSREYFFEICKVKKHAITVSFIPTSDSYNNYGPHLTIDIILTDEELQEQIRNYSAKPPLHTSGQIKAKVLIKDNLSKQQITRAAEVGFHTKDVFEVLHV
jgi:hypothetical protein